MQSNRSFWWGWKLVVVAVLTVLCLGGEWLYAGTFLGQVRDEVLAVLKDPDIQWMVFACFSVYFISFNWLSRERAGQGILVQALGVILFAAGLLIYIWAYWQASLTTDALVLCFGLALFLGIKFWHYFEFSRTKSFPLAGAFVSSMLLLFCLALESDHQMGQQFNYRGQHRWSGVWDNPIMAGVLTAVGVVLASGWAVFSLKSKVQSWSTAAQEGQKAESRRWKTESWRWVGIALLGIAAIICGIGLVKSYSRGAWLGAVVGLSYLIGSAFWRPGFGRYERKSESGKLKAEISCGSWLNRNGLAVAVGVISLVVIGFWNYRHTEHTFTRRVASVANANDFSSRNRIAAWQGALQMASEKPLLGFGWNMQDQIYEEFYRQSRIEAWRAIRTNDFFKLCNTLGIPALGCFALLVGYSLSSKSNGQGPRSKSLSPVTEHTSLALACRAGVVVLLVSFWFDGADSGLFRLASGSLFWILLALGGVEQPPPATARQVGGS